MASESNTSTAPEYYDIAVIGGGINGAGTARDAAGRGYRVLLIEKDDLGSHTSSASSKLIHGGLRYLEYYQFKLVREALNEREVLLNIAPHIIWPLRFMLPHHPQMRPVWMIRTGLWLYDVLGRRKKLPASGAVNLRDHSSGQALKPEYKKGFVYSDCWVQDSRLVVLNAVDAALNSARVLTRTRCISAKAESGGWALELSDNSGRHHTIKTKFIVNATGPWVTEFLETTAGIKHDHRIRLVSGSHIVVPKLFDHEMAYIFQNTDNRIVFALPYEGQYTLIGTTEYDVKDPQAAEISDQEVQYLCNSVNRYFKRSIRADDVVWHFTGVRPLFDDGSDQATSATREYVLDLHETPAPCLSILGGKITTYRSLAEKALELIDLYFGRPSKPWTSTKPLPGGDFHNADFDSYLHAFKQQRPWLGETLARYYVRNYGTRAQMICNDAQSLADLGQAFGAGLYQAEIDYLINHEWAKTTVDVLWRRSKWGLHIKPEEVQAVDDFLSDSLTGFG